MNRIARRLAVALLAAALVAPAIGTGNAFADEPLNLVTNPSFELTAGGEPTGWTEALRTAGPISAGAATDAAREGGTSLKIEALPPAAGQPTPRLSVFQVVDGIVAGEAYAYSGWVKTNNAVTGGNTPVRLYFLDADDPWYLPYATNFVTVNAGLTGTHGWTRVGALFYAPAGATRLVIELLPHASQGTFWFDEQQVTPYVPEPLEPANLLGNAGFDETTGGEANDWNEALRVPGPTAASADGVTYRNGTHALKIEAQAADPDPRLSVYQVVEGIVPGTTYRFTAWVKTLNATTGGTMPVRLYFLDATGPWYAAMAGTQLKPIHANLTGTNDWTRIEATVVAPPGAARMVVENLPLATEGTFWFDDETLVPLSPTAAALEPYRDVHPRLLLDANKVAALKTAIAPQGTHAALWNEFIASVDATMNVDPQPYYTDPSEEENWQRATGYRAVNFAFAYLMTDDEDYLEEAVEAVSASIQYPSWGRGIYKNSDLAAGHQLFALAAVYDWLYDELDSATKASILETLQERGMEMYMRAAGLPYDGKASTMYWSKQYLQNHMWINLAGLTAASIALFDEVPSAIPWFDFSRTKFAKVADVLGDDGASHEGYAYWHYGALWAAKYAKIEKKFVGGQLLQTDWFRNNSKYAAYSMLGRDFWTLQRGFVDYGDAFKTQWQAPDHLLRMIAAEHDDGLAQWLAAEIDDRGLPPPPDRWLGILFYDPSVPETPPTSLPTMRHFTDMDMVMSRTGWGGDESVLYFRSGPPLGHEEREKNVEPPVGDWGAGHVHPDVNHFVLHANGEYLLRDDGYANKRTANHNTLLINGSGQLGDGVWFDYAKDRAQLATPHIVLAQTGPVFDYMSGEGAGAYDMAGTGLEKFRRHLLFIKPNALIVVDEIELDAPQDLELRFHPESQQIASAGANSYLLTSASNAMRFQALTPTGAQVTAGPVPYSSLAFSGNRTALRLTKADAVGWRNAVAFTWAENGVAPASVALTQNGDVWTFDTGTEAVALNLATGTAAAQ
jgi:hypothetical protein